MKSILDQIELTNEDFHYCYSKRVSDFLSYKGIKYIKKGVNTKNDKIYSMYLKNSKLQNALNEYRQLNQE